MCVILTNKKQKISIDEVISAWMVNSDGAGLIVEGEDHPFKFKTLKSFLNFYKKIDENKKIIAHFRISTGGVGMHPFKIPYTPYYLFHNGICGKSRNGKSDTRILAQKLSGLEFSEIEAALIFLNKTGKGKFCISTSDLSFSKCIGFTFRSNENHLYKEPKYAPPKYAPQKSNWKFDKYDNFENDCIHNF